MNKKIADQINQISFDLRLPALRKKLKEIIEEAVKENASFEQVILNVLKAEQHLRQINRKKVQMRNAAFPQLKHLQDIKRSNLPADAIANYRCSKHWTLLPLIRMLSWVEVREPGKLITR